MKKKTRRTISQQGTPLLYALLGFIAGLLVAIPSVALINRDHQTILAHFESEETDETDHMNMSMREMTEALQDKSGDEFDKAFLEMMIAHHQGAVDMAELIPARAKHDEIKHLGESIISAQTKEINDMEQWFDSWGYNMSSSGHMH